MLVVTTCDILTRTVDLIEKWHLIEQVILPRTGTHVNINFLQDQNVMHSPPPLVNLVRKFSLIAFAKQLGISCSQENVISYTRSAREKHERRKEVSSAYTNFGEFL